MSSSSGDSIIGSLISPSSTFPLFLVSIASSLFVICCITSITLAFVIALPPRRPPRPILTLKYILNPLILSLKPYSMLFCCSYTTNDGGLGAGVRDSVSIRETISSISWFNSPSASSLCSDIYLTSNQNHGVTLVSNLRAPNMHGSSISDLTVDIILHWVVATEEYQSRIPSPELLRNASTPMSSKFQPPNQTLSKTLSPTSDF